ncbi:hypothetical protein TrLO_g11688 [Triparma laevis f. longispina]|uniref:Uncharacterized protein n=1 Tax=Triparma laevis f. longispina TaxID=1714387 RepID=A0A9W7C043_9STRA|nr:hypothetical protein TrLO_g11688 [Triparma laevis f. longispina]
MTFTFLFFLLLFSQVHSFLHPPPKTFLKASSEPRLSRRHHPPFTPSSIPLKCSPLFSVHHTASVVIADLTRAAGIGLIGVLGSYVSQTVIKEEAEGYDAREDFERYDEEEYEEEEDIVPTRRRRSSSELE